MLLFLLWFQGLVLPSQFTMFAKNADNALRELLNVTLEFDDFHALLHSHEALEENLTAPHQSQSIE